MLSLQREHEFHVCEVCQVYRKIQVLTLVDVTRIDFRQVNRENPGNSPKKLAKSTGFTVGLTKRTANFVKLAWEKQLDEIDITKILLSLLGGDWNFVKIAWLNTPIKRVLRSYA